MECAVIPLKYASPLPPGKAPTTYPTPPPPPASSISSPPPHPGNPLTPRAPLLSCPSAARWRHQRHVSMAGVGPGAWQRNDLCKHHSPQPLHALIIVKTTLRASLSGTFLRKSQYHTPSIAFRHLPLKKSQNHTPSIAFRHLPPKEGCRKSVLGVESKQAVSLRKANLKPVLN